MTGAPAGAARLEQRLRAAAEVVLVDVPVPTGDTAYDAAQLLSALVELVRSAPRADLAWLLLAAVSGHLPVSDDVHDLVRHLELALDPTDAEIGVLRRAKAAVAVHGDVELPVRVVTDAVLVDVNFSAQDDMHTGIQRVAREVSPRWHQAHDVMLTGWIPGGGAMRTLVPEEEARVLAWSGRGGSDPIRRPTANGSDPWANLAGTEVVIPWHCTVVLPEVSQGYSSLPLAALAEHSGSSVVAIGYDAIPVVSADMRPPTEPSGYVKYLTVLKHAKRVAAISRSAAAEFRGFTEALAAQGIAGPRVTEVLLAAEVPDATDAPSARTPGPARVLCVGSHEPHKNHLGLLHAAELLWREGLPFELDFVGGRGWDVTLFDAALAELVARGRSVRNLGPVTDSELWACYRDATFTVFPSLHEGFGLPVAESLACGTPVVTTRYGSTAEIAERGGCLLIDPRDDADLAAAMRTMLTDRSTYAVLKEQAARTVGRTWDDYAAELWSTLVDDVRRAS